MILGIDTSTALTSVALVEDGEVLAQREHLDPRRHAEVLAPLLAEVLASVPGAVGRVGTVACGVGPGPYTGLRVGIATARAVASAWQVPAVGLCSLDAVAAAHAPGASAFGVALDARRGERYWALYDADGRRAEGPRVDRPEDLPAVAGPWIDDLPRAAWVARRVADLIGRGVLVSDTSPALSPHGGDGGPTAQALAGADLLACRPLYLRRPDAVPVAP